MSELPHDEGSAQLEGWHRPVTTDAKAYASAYATAIWTYDTNQHDYFDWEDAVKLFADPMDSGTARVAGEHAAVLRPVEAAETARRKRHGERGDGRDASCATAAG